MKNKSTYLKIFIFVILVLAAKILIATQFSGPQVIPDESCVFVKAKALIRTGELVNCNSLFNRLTGDPFPFYSIVIAPIYMVFKNDLFYPAVLIFNVLLVTSLIFPLKKILEKISSKRDQNDKKNWLIIFTVLFTPAVLVYEKLGMTETLFAVLNIWGLYFYLNSFTPGKILNKSLAILFALMAGFTRPFGFVTIIAIVFNEIIIAKKKRFLSIIGITLITLISVLINNFLPNIFPSLFERLTLLSSLKNLGYLWQAFVNQFNSLIWATWLVPLFLFIYHFFSEKNESFRKIRFFLLFLISSIFIVSLQHLYGYFIEGLETSISTRYINLPIILITFFGLHFLGKKVELNARSSILISLFAVLQLLVPPISTSDGVTLIFGSPLITSTLIKNFFILICILGVGLLSNKARALFISLILLFFSQSYVIISDLAIGSTMANKNHPVNAYLKNHMAKDNSEKILYISRGSKFTECYWSILSTRDYKIDLVFFDENSQNPTLIDSKSKTLSVRRTNFNADNFDLSNSADSSTDEIDMADYNYLISTIPMPGFTLLAEGYGEEFLYEIKKIPQNS